MMPGSCTGLLLWLFFFLSGCGAGIEKEDDYLKISNLIDDKNYFKARTLLFAAPPLSEKQRLIVEAKLDHAFNALQLSNQKINRLFEMYPNELSDSIALDLLLLRTRNNGKLFAYGKAYDSMDDLLTTHRSLLTEAEYNDYHNERKIWKILSRQPGQTVRVEEKTVLPIIRDKAQLPNLKVTDDSVALDFVFDTGANFSTATETTAALFNMNLLKGSIEVGAITGAKIQARLAVCPELRLGDIQVKNAVFIVFPDSALAFPHLNYQINGILGFPVIEAFKEIRISRSGQFIVPKVPSAYSGQNLALDFLTPVIQIEGGYYTFDSGAQRTQLYTKYFRRYKEHIEERYDEAEVKYGGAGGLVTATGYYVEFSPVINGKEVKIDSVQLLSGNIEESKAHFYGNIGQDLIHEFDCMTINFEAMVARFE